MQMGPKSPPEKLGSPKDLGPPWSKSIIAPVLPTHNFQNTDTAEIDEIRQLATILLSHPKTILLLSRSS